MEVLDRYEPEILYWGVDWNSIKDACLETISKRAGEGEPPELWKKKLLISQHSPIRRSMISIRWKEIPYCTSVHFCRHHEGVEKFVQSSREDRSSVKDRSERKQTDFVSMQMDMNIQGLLNIMEKRLCNQADKETRKYALGLLRAIAKKDETIAWACIPQGIRTCGCPEMFGTCNACTNMIQGLNFEDRLDMMKRYDYYNVKRKCLVRKPNDVDK